ncbi:MAG: hypothetical protein J7K26_04250 [Candidatus Aenigmarchaeota archaeon]|nr:hypothetical protein [Candidatus Aenigmarchaeota archaeon]
MKKYAPTNVGFRLLERTGLKKRIDENWSDISYIIPNKVTYEDEFNEIIDELLNNRNLESSRKMAISNLKNRKDIRNGLSLSEDLFVVSGKVTDEILTQEEKRNYREFGVEALCQLDGLIASYCLEKHNDEIRKSYTWRSDKFKTMIYGDTHGDLNISQHKIEAEINKNTIDGTEVAQLFGKLPYKNMNAHYDHWLLLVGVALKYADTVGIEIPEADDWVNFMRSCGWEGEILNPLYDHTDMNFIRNYSSMEIAQLPDKTDVTKIRKMFFGRMTSPYNNDYWWYPVIDEEENLVFCSNNGNDITLKTNRYIDEKYNKDIYIEKKYARHLFIGAVHGIMANQSRTSPENLASMICLYNRVRKGEKVEDIINSLRNVK